MENSKGRAYFLLVLLGCVSVVAFFVFRPFLTTIILAAVFAVLLYPLYRRLRIAVRNSAGASIVTVLLGTVLVLIPLILIGSLVVSEAQQTYVSITSCGSVPTIEHMIVSIAQWFEPNFPGITGYAHSISTQLNAYAAQALWWLLERVGVAFTGLPVMLLRFLIFFMTLYYLLKEGSAIERFLIKQSPFKSEEAETIVERLKRTLNSIVKGSFIIACVQGTLAGVGYALFGVPNPALWGVLTAISALIPGVGTSIILVPVFLYLLIFGTLGEAIGLGLWGTLLVGLIDNFLAPHLMGRGAELHPLLILLSMLGGIALFGPVGIFIGPLTVSLLFILYSIYVGHSSASSSN